MLRQIQKKISIQTLPTRSKIFQLGPAVLLEIVHQDQLKATLNQFMTSLSEGICDKVKLDNSDECRLNVLLSSRLTDIFNENRTRKKVCSHLNRHSQT